MKVHVESDEKELGQLRDELRRRTVDADAAAARAQQNMDQAQRDLLSVRDQLAAATRTCDERQQEVAAIQQRLKDLEGTMSAEREKHVREMSVVRAELTVTQQRLATASSELTELQQTHQSSVTALDVAEVSEKAAKEALEVEVAQRERLTREHNEHMDKLRRRVEVAQDERVQALSDADALRLAMKAAEKRVVSLQSECSELKQLNAHVQRECTDLRQHLLTALSTPSSASSSSTSSPITPEIASALAPHSLPLVWSQLKTTQVALAASEERARALEQHLQTYHAQFEQVAQSFTAVAAQVTSSRAQSPSQPLPLPQQQHPQQQPHQQQHQHLSQPESPPVVTAEPVVRESRRSSRATKDADAMSVISSVDVTKKPSLSRRHTSAPVASVAEAPEPAKEKEKEKEKKYVMEHEHSVHFTVLVCLCLNIFSDRNV
jgi:predicted  nucleic acid-binding Zn-ribbon protein